MPGNPLRPSFRRTTSWLPRESNATDVVPIDTTTTPQSIESFAAEVGDMESLEAPNECDVPGNCGGNAVNGVLNMLAFLPTLQAAATESHVPLLGPSFTLQSSYPLAGNLASEIAVNNLHIYFGGRNPGSAGWGALDAQGNAYGSFAWWLHQGAIHAPGLASVITETGYMAYPSTATPYTLPRMLKFPDAPRTLLLAYNHGIQKTYFYELLDEVSSPAYGLMNSDLTPKPAFTALRNCSRFSTTRLKDPSPHGCSNIPSRVETQR